MSASNKSKAPANKAINGYVPAYQAPPEPPAPLPAPKVENKIEVPETVQITTMTDLVERIQGIALPRSVNGRRASLMSIQRMLRSFSRHPRV